MFTGIVQSVQPILETRDRKKIRSVRIQIPRGWRLQMGESIAIDGICSTVVKKDQRSFTVEYMPETLDLTTAQHFAALRPVNLERSLTLATRIDGHLVQGHVDALAKVILVQREGESRRISFAVTKKLSKFIAAKGSIAVNGVSLTVTEKRASAFSVALIPYTLVETTLGKLERGDTVNIEVDILARYLESLRKSKT